MTKVIENIRILRKLERYLEDMETEYICCIDWEDNWQFSWHTTRIVKSNTKNIEIYNWWDKCQSGTDFYKTLTLEEAIELLNKVERKILEEYFEKNNIKRTDVLFYILGWWIELILQYLVDNNFLWKK